MVGATSASQADCHQCTVTRATLQEIQKLKDEHSHLGAKLFKMEKQLENYKTMKNLSDECEHYFDIINKTNEDELKDERVKNINLELKLAEKEKEINHLLIDNRDAKAMVKSQDLKLELLRVQLAEREQENADAYEALIRSERRIARMTLENATLQSELNALTKKVRESESGSPNVDEFNAFTESDVDDDLESLFRVEDDWDPSSLGCGDFPRSTEERIAILPIAKSRVKEVNTGDQNMSKVEHSSGSETSAHQRQPRLQEMKGTWCEGVILDILKEKSGSYGMCGKDMVIDILKDLVTKECLERNSLLDERESLESGRNSSRFCSSSCGTLSDKKSSGSESRSSDVTTRPAELNPSKEIIRQKSRAQSKSRQRASKVVSRRGKRNCLRKEQVKNSRKPKKQNVSSPGTKQYSRIGSYQEGFLKPGLKKFTKLQTVVSIKDGVQNLPKPLTKLHGVCKKVADEPNENIPCLLEVDDSFTSSKSLHEDSSPKEKTRPIGHATDKEHVSRNEERKSSSNIHKCKTKSNSLHGNKTKFKLRTDQMSPTRKTKTQVKEREPKPKNLSPLNQGTKSSKSPHYSAYHINFKFSKHSSSVPSHFVKLNTVQRSLQELSKSSPSYVISPARSKTGTQTDTHKKVGRKARAKTVT